MTAHTTTDMQPSEFIYGINSSKALRMWITVSSRLCCVKANVSALTFSEEKKGKDQRLTVLLHYFVKA